jgi:hypothetical protein
MIYIALGGELSRILPEGNGKGHKNLVKIAGILDDIRSKDVLNMNPECYRYANPLAIMKGEGLRYSIL